MNQSRSHNRDELTPRAEGPKKMWLYYWQAAINVLSTNRIQWFGSVCIMSIEPLSPRVFQPWHF